jgi:hypothetical protein
MEYELKVNEQDAQLILQALGELPLKATLTTFLKVNGQIIEAQKSKSAATL